MRKPAFLGHALNAAIDLYNRQSWTENQLVLLPREPGPLYAEDGLATFHAHRFVQEPAYARAYARSIRACGYDYKIRWRAYTLLWAAKRCLDAEGAYVECGTGRGFMATAVCEYLGWGERPFYLFDTFLSTYPDASGVQSPEGVVHTNYAEGPEQVARNFAEWPGVKLMVGRIPEVLTDTGPVAFLHVDLNNAVSEEHAVRHFWPSLSPGGAMIFDDYGFGGYEPQRESADRLAAELGFEIFSLPTGQGLVLRER